MIILYEDSQILVCYKEGGLPVQSARIGARDLVSILKNYLWEQNGRSAEPYLGIVHRIDQPVEGVLVFAKTPKAARNLSAQLTDGRMKKIYRAVVRKSAAGPDGKPLPEEGALTDFLLIDKKTNLSRIVPEGTKDAKYARLDYRILDRIPAPENQEGFLSLAEIRLHTGRHHQIRVQMAHAAMPLCGDRKYSFPGEKGSLALCAASLCLFHPETGKPMEFCHSAQGEYFRLFEGHDCDTIG